MSQGAAAAAADARQLLDSSTCLTNLRSPATHVMPTDEFTDGGTGAAVNTAECFLIRQITCYIRHLFLPDAYLQSAGLSWSSCRVQNDLPNKDL